MLLNKGLMMATPLALRIAEQIDAAIMNFDGYSQWREMVGDEEWKITAEYTALPVDKIAVRAIRRDINKVEVT